MEDWITTEGDVYTDADIKERAELSGIDVDTYAQVMKLSKSNGDDKKDNKTDANSMTLSDGTIITTSEAEGKQNAGATNTTDANVSAENLVSSLDQSSSELPGFNYDDDSVDGEQLSKSNLGTVDASNPSQVINTTLNNMTSEEVKFEIPKEEDLKIVTDFNSIKEYKEYLTLAVGDGFDFDRANQILALAQDKYATKEGGGLIEFTDIPTQEEIIEIRQQQKSLFNA
ncbi:unnamed protein product, partial [marine sediment metagenome]